MDAKYKAKSSGDLTLRAVGQFVGTIRTPMSGLVLTANMRRLPSIVYGTWIWKREVLQLRLREIRAGVST